MPISTIICPFDQVYMKGKGCILNSKIHTTMQNQFQEHFQKPDEKIKLSESENLKLDKLFSTEKSKNFKSSNHEKFKIIDDLITGHEKFSKDFHIFLNNPKYEIFQEKLNQKSKSIEDSSKSIHHSNHFEWNNKDGFETFSDISLKSPFDLVVEPKSKHESLKLIDFPNTSQNIFMKSKIPEKKNWIQMQFEQKFPSSFEFKESSENLKNKLIESPLETKFYSVKETPRVGQNLELFQGIDGKNMVFEFNEPYKLSENEKNLVHDKSSKIYFNPSKTAKSGENQNNYQFKNWFSKAEKSSAKYNLNNQGDFKFEIPGTINFDHKYLIDLDPRTKLTAINFEGTDMSNSNSKTRYNFNGYKDLSGSKSNKYRIQWIGSSDQKNTEFIPIKPSHTSIDIYSLSKLNRKNQEERTPPLKIKWIPTTREDTLNNYEAISLQKENEELKKLLSKIYSNRDIKFGVQNEGFDNLIDSKHQIISNSGIKFSQPMQTTIVKSSMLDKKVQNPLFFQSEFSKAKEGNNNTNNANYLDILMKIIALANDGKEKKSSNFTYSTRESANRSSTFLSKPMISTLPIDDEPIVDEGELSDESNQLVNSFQKNIAASKFTPKNGLNSTKDDSLPTKNNLKENSSVISENIKMINEETKNFDRASNEVKKASNNIANDSNIKNSPVIGTTTLSNQTSEQLNLHKKLLNSVEKISTEGSSKILNAVPNLFDFDHSTIGFPKQKNEDVNTILNASPASYSFKSVNIPKMKDEAESIRQKASSDVDGLSSIASDLLF